MKILEPLFIEVAEKLLECEVEFMLIGGYAVNYYGFARYTGDMDFWLRPSNENKVKFIKALEILGRNKEDIELLKTYDFTIPQVVSMGEQPLRIDFLTKVNLVSFEDAWLKKNLLRIKNFDLPVIEYNHLIQTKINTGRSKDNQDILMLQKINGGESNSPLQSFYQKFISLFSSKK